MRCAMSERATLVVLVGPTAVGKTELSLRLCELFGGEVVSADSRQIYREMDIGTAKATPVDQARVPHHLLDLRAPDQVLTLAEYQQLAYAAIDDIHRRGRVPFLVGGERAVCALCGGRAANPRSAAQSAAAGSAGRRTGTQRPGTADRSPAAVGSGDGGADRSAQPTPRACGHWRSC